MTGPATAVARGETALAELARTHGALTSDIAVFGTTPAATEPVPTWITHWPAVRHRLDRKDPSGLSRTTWWRVAALATQGHQLLRPQPAPSHALDNAIRLAAAVARTLPQPPRSLLLGPTSEADKHLARWGPSTGAIEAALSRLCRALDDPTWTDPDALAGWIADAQTALATYRAELGACQPQARRARSEARLPAPHPRTAGACGRTLPTTTGGAAE